jgi:ABC-type uncharacterized transport system auxiliary subunit
MMHPRTAVPLFALLAATLAGCSGLRSREPASVSYTLRPPAAVSSAAPVAPDVASRLAATSLQVVKVMPQPGYAGDRVLLRLADQSLSHYAGARWADNLPRVVESLAAAALRGSGGLRSVQDDAGPFLADYSLRLTIRRFDAELAPGQEAGTGTPTVRVAFDCVLGRRSDRSVVMAFSAEGSAQPGAHRMGAVIPAFEAAAQAALSSVAAQTLAALAADTAQPAR